MSLGAVLRVAVAAALPLVIAAGGGCERWHVLGTANLDGTAGTAGSAVGAGEGAAGTGPAGTGAAGTADASADADAMGTGLAGTGAAGTAGTGAAGTAAAGESGGAGAGGAAGTGDIGTLAVGCPAPPPRPCPASCDLAHSNCVQGVCTNGARRWLTLGGDNRHSGWAVNETGGPPVKRAWRVQVSKPIVSEVLPVVADDDTVYVVDKYVRSTNQFFPSTNDHVWALAASDGHTRWSVDFGFPAEFPTDVVLGMPTLADGRLFVTEGQASLSPSALDVFLARTGKLLWAQTFEPGHFTGWAPLAVGPALYFQDDNGLRAIDLDRCAPAFYNKNLGSAAGFSPLALGGAIFTFTGGKLQRFDPVTGNDLIVAAIPPTNYDYSQYGAPVSDGDAIYGIHPGTLSAFKPDHDAPLWVMQGQYDGIPAVANGVLYAIGDRQLSARDPATGEISWTAFDGEYALRYPPVVAGNWVYAASEAHVYAFDIRTHKLAWTESPGGWLSIAAGQLLVAQPDGYVSAYPLSP